jgi:hypothetical protein
MGAGIGDTEPSHDGPIQNLHGGLLTIVGLGEHLDLIPSRHCMSSQTLDMGLHPSDDWSVARGHEC